MCGERGLLVAQQGVDVPDAPCCGHVALTVLDQLPEERSSSNAPAVAD